MGVVSVLDDDANNLVDKLVYDLNGNPIGKVGADGMVYDSVGKIIGRTNFDGSVVDLQGKRIGSVPKTNIIMAKNGTMKGKVEPRRAIFDGAGRIIGYVNDKGDVVDMAGNNIDAKVLADGTIVDSTGRSLGTLRQADFLVDNQGNAIGFVGTDGTLYDIAGGAIGSVDKSGNIIDRNGNVLGSIQRPSAGILRSGSYVSAGGAVLPSRGTSVYDTNGNLIGSVGTDGQVRDTKGNVIGRVNEDGTVVDNSGRVIGATGASTAYTGQRVYDASGNTIGMVDADGMIKDSMGRIVGRVLSDGTAVSLSGRKVGGAGSPAFTGQTVYDARGNAIGTVDKNGIIRDAYSNAVGRVDRNGIAYSLDGARRLGFATGNVFPEYQGGAVYDNSGRVIGTVGTDGMVRDASGQIMGRISSDGSVVDSVGRTIGRAERPSAGGVASYIGQKVLDSSGRVIGTVGTDGMVRDTSGQVVGRIDPAGSVVDNAGMTIGKAERASPSAGATYVGQRVFDNEGKLIGTVGADGQVRDASGQVVGEVMTDGSVVDSNGRTIGKTISTAAYLGQKIYDDNGNLVGTVGADGQVRDASGQVVGKVLANGRVVNEKGRTIGRVASSPASYIGQKVYDTAGNLIGSVGKGGRVLDEDGNVIGRVLADGVVVDEEGKAIGQISTLDSSLPSFGGEGKTDTAFMGRTISPTVFDNLGAFGDYGSKSLGKGGGFGPGERYSSERVAQLNALQQARRSSASWGKFQAPEFKGTSEFKDKDWSRIGFGKVLSSRPVNMNRVIVKGKAIPAVLVNSVDSRFSTIPVTAVVERNIYASDGRNIVIPAGSWLVGTSDGSGELGGYVAKVEIEWTRLVRPDGVAFALTGNTGDAMGRGGVPGYLDRRLFDKYFTPLVSEIGADLVTIAMASSKSSTIADSGAVSTSDRQQAYEDARSNWTETSREIVRQILKDYTDIAAVINIPSGTRLTAFAEEDLWLILPEEVEDLSYTPKNVKPLIRKDAAAASTPAPTYTDESSRLTSGGTGAGSLSGGTYQVPAAQQQQPRQTPLIAPSNQQQQQQQNVPVYNPPGAAPIAGTGASGTESSAPQGQASVPRLF